ncbi:acyl transferase [Ascidiimonas sp. W6]|uniref:LuxE/PaaK family acyltransferase n=1 Tax=Ascidiimonas meishanensis TaxID=3128903 RepID=UPI0030EDB2D7
MNSKNVFNIKTREDFEKTALNIFQYQYKNNVVYQNFCGLLKKNPALVKEVDDIPFLPIQFFKSHQVITGNLPIEEIFTSSGTTGSTYSKHYVTDLSIYQQSYLKSFQKFYGSPKDYVILALLPSYLERKGSSLIFMAEDLIKKSGKEESGFYLHDLKKLSANLKKLEAANQKTLLIGVTFALLDLAEKYPQQLHHTIVMETGGMKGRRKEMIREEVHDILQDNLNVTKVHSEYGMTELLSQAYSKGDGIFTCPPWMQINTRDPEDALSKQAIGKTGGINIIDLANINSCAFIATQDLGKVYADGSFEILGRFDHSDIRGCNLMAL